MKKVILFNGEDEVIVTPEQIKEMGKSSPRELVAMFQATTVYRDVMLDLIRDMGKAVLSVNDSPLNQTRVAAVEEGYRTITEEMVEVFGEHTTDLILVDINNAIKNEKDGRV
jgi:uncharacterized protein YbcI